jgi:ferredoxin--NADP+ reductase
VTEPQLNAVVTAKEEISPRLMIMRVAAAGWQMPEFEPGQFASLGLPGSAPRCALSMPEQPPSDPGKLIQRAYSIASSSRTREYMEFYISLVTSGALTPRLFALDVGDRLWLSPKATGMFTLDQVPRDKHVIMVATGTGLAPYISMLTTEMPCGNPRRFAVLHGADHSWDLGYRPESEPVPWSGLTGWVQDLWRKGVVAQDWGFSPTPADTHVFLCGNPLMLEAMVALLQGEGFREQSQERAGEIHVERS